MFKLNDYYQFSFPLDGRLNSTLIINVKIIRISTEKERRKNFLLHLFSPIPFTRTENIAILIIISPWSLDYMFHHINESIFRKLMKISLFLLVFFIFIFFFSSHLCLPFPFFLSSFIIITCIIIKIHLPSLPLIHPTLHFVLEVNVSVVKCKMKAKEK